MDRKGGTATAAIVVAAVLGFSVLPRTGSESGGGSRGSRTEQAAGKLQRSGAQKVQACEQIVKRLSRFSSDEVPISSREVPMIQSCYSDPGAYRPSATHIYPEVYFAIALVPNPIQTHLPLAFDRSIEVIQEAAQDNNFIYDSSWFPWDHPDKSLELYADQKLADAEMETQQLQPGIMVFRAGASAPAADPGKPGGDVPYAAGLVVFVVGEQPTGGINDRQFENAMSWLETLQSETPRPLKILGPAFSGSLPSLARELDVSTLSKFPGGIQIYSGSINSEWSVRWFKNFTEQKSQPPKNTIDFRTFNESDALMMNRFLCYLEHGKYDLRRVAILSEDETAFGRASESGKDDAKNSRSASPLCAGDKDSASPIHLYYPRDIATLRSAYERQGIFSAAKGQANNAPGTMLQGDLSESPGEEHDSVRTYAGQLTPLAQESVLFGIANLLQQKHVEFVIVTSTNSLDQLFISEFLRRSYPSGRVVLDGADLLFRRGMEGASLRGVMLLSTYPLMPWTQDGIPVLSRSSSGEWQFEGRPASKDSYRIFSEDFVEGTYIAARELFPSGTSGVAISDYAPPRLALKRDGDLDDNRRPLTWVSVVGHRQFWPIAMLNSYTQSNSPNPRPGVSNPSLPDLSLLKAASGELLPSGSGAGQTPLEGTGARIERFLFTGATMPGEMVALLIAAVAFSLWHAWLCWNGSMTGSPRVRAYFAPVPEVQHSILIFLGSLFLGVFAITVLGGSGTTSALAWKFWSGNFLVWTLVSVLIIVVCGLVGLIANYRLTILPGIASRTEQRFAKPWVWGVVWLLLLVVVAWLRNSLLTSHLDISNQIPTVWRSVHFRSGVSPLLPQVLLIAGLYGWFWFSLRGLALFGDDRPVLPRLHSLPDFIVDPKLGPVFESEDDTLDRSTCVSGETFARQNALRNTEMRGFRMFSQEEAGEPIEQAALPLTRKQVGLFLVALFVALFACWAALGTSMIRTLGDRNFGYLIFIGMCVFIALILTDTMQFLNTWGRLRTLLVFLDRLRLRRTLACLKGISWQSVWSMSGNVLEERYRLLSRQMESTQHLQNELERWNPSAEEAANKKIALKQLKECQEQGFQFARWYVDLIAGKTPESIAPLQQYQETLAKTAGRIMGHVILPEWMKERHSLILEPAASSERKSDSKEEDKGSAENSGHEEKRAPLNPRVRAAEEFFVLLYLGFIQNIMGRIRTIMFSILALFVAVTLAMSSYPFDPLPVIGAIFLVLFLMVGGAVIFAYAEMHRNATLSNITNTNPGELGMDFWVRLFAYGAGPLAALLTTLFPSITDFVVSFLQPGAQAIK